MHPAKTKIVYCKDSGRRGSYEHTSFTFLGFTFRPRAARRKDGSMFTRFLPAISKDALKKISGEVRSPGGCTARSAIPSAELARWINPVVAGWMHYYGRFYRSALYPLLARINAYLVRWIRKKYKRLRGPQSPRKLAAGHRDGIPASSRTGHGSPQPGCDQDDKSRMNREVHVRICGSREVRFPPATRLAAVRARMRCRTRTVTPLTVRPPCRSRSSWPLRVSLTDSMICRNG